MIVPAQYIRPEWVTPFTPAKVQAGSYDLALAGNFVDLKSGQSFFADKLSLLPGDAILASTAEVVTLPADVCGVLYLKSSAARRGLDHALAGWIDAGFTGQITLELHAHREIELVVGVSYCQLVFVRMEAVTVKPYQGRYQGQRGPTEAR